jgi:hypothetical protein
VPYSPSSSGGSNTDAIAGGVAGGVVALVVAIVLLFFWRRNRRAEEPVIFDTDRVVRDADHTDLEGMEVTPFSYTPTTGTFSVEQHSQPSD